MPFLIIRFSFPSEIENLRLYLGKRRFGEERAIAR